MDLGDGDDILDLIPHLSSDSIEALRKRGRALHTDVQLHMGQTQWFPPQHTPTAREYVARLAKNEMDVLAHMFVSASSLDEIEKMEQRTPEWFAARKGRCTSSNIGKILHHVDFGVPMTDKDLAADMLGMTTRTVTTSGKRNMAYGTAKEDPACKQFVTETASRVETLVKLARSQGRSTFLFLTHLFEVPPESEVECQPYCHVEMRGLSIHPIYQWLGASVDGIVYVLGKVIGALEIKCPYGKALYPIVPIAYLDQMHAHSICAGTPRCLMYVWTPHVTFCDVHEHNAAYREQVILPGVKKFFFEVLLPMMANLK
jgi:hypothetical protein